MSGPLLEVVDAFAAHDGAGVFGVVDKVIETGTDGVSAAKRLGNETYDRATETFRSVDIDGDGIPDKPRAQSAVEDAGSAIKGVTAGAAGAVGSLFRRKRDGSTPKDQDAAPALEGN